MANAKKTPAATAFITDKLDRKMLEQSLTALGLKFTATDKATTLANLLNEYYVKNTAKDALVRCDVCGVMSSADLDSCPACGHDDSVTGDAGNAEAEDTAEGDETATPEESEEGEETAEGDETEGPTDATPKKRGRPGKALAPVAIVEVLPEGVTVEALESGVANYRKIRDASYGNFWDLGQAVRAIFEGQLWKARRDDAGTGPRFKNFDAFAREELGVTNVQALKYIEVSKAYTREEVIALGTSKLGLVLDAPAEARPKLLEAAKGGASKADLAAAVKEAKEKAKASGVDVHAEKDKEKGKASTSAAGKGREVENVKVSSFLGNKQIVLFKKPVKGPPTEVAMGIEDAGVVGSIEMGNVVFFFNIIKLPSGQLNMKLSGQRNKKA